MDDLRQVELDRLGRQRRAVAERVVVAVREDPDPIVDVGGHRGEAELVHEVRPLVGDDAGVEEAHERVLPGAEEAGAAAGADQAAVPVGADLHLADGGLDEGAVLDPEQLVHPAPVGLALALAARARDPAIDRAHGGDPIALGELRGLAGEDAIGVGEDERFVVELALRPRRHRDLVEGGRVGEAIDQRLVDEGAAEVGQPLDRRRLGLEARPRRERVRRRLGVGAAPGAQALDQQDRLALEPAVLDAE